MCKTPWGRFVADRRVAWATISNVKTQTDRRREKHHDFYTPRIPALFTGKTFFFFLDEETGDKQETGVINSNAVTIPYIHYTLLSV